MGALNVFWLVVGLLAGLGFGSSVAIVARCLQPAARAFEVPPDDDRLFVFEGAPDPQIRERIADAWSN